MKVFCIVLRSRARKDNTNKVRKAGRNEEIRQVTGEVDKMDGRRSLFDFCSYIFMLLNSHDTMTVADLGHCDWYRFAAVIIQLNQDNISDLSIAPSSVYIPDGIPLNFDDTSLPQ